MSRACYMLILCASLLISGCSSVVNKPAIDAPVPGLTAAFTQCDIQPAVDWMVSQRIIYSQTPNDEWRDCSGNFLRLSSRIADICEGVDMVAPPGIKKYVHGGDNKRPAPAQARTTRGIAKWYDQKGLFVPVFYDDTELTKASADLVRIRNRIKPGSVLWFSRKKPLKADGKTALYDEQTGIINHMGTVISVTRDARNNVTGWDMYHGQNARKHNEVTSHTWVWPASLTSRGQQYPPGGYWDQRIVGFADHIVPPAPL